MADTMLASPGATENAVHNNGTMNSMKAFILSQKKLGDLSMRFNAKFYMNYIVL